MLGIVKLLGLCVQKIKSPVGLNGDHRIIFLQTNRILSVRFQNSMVDTVNSALNRFLSGITKPSLIIIMATIMIIPSGQSYECKTDKILFDIY